MLDIEAGLPGNWVKKSATIGNQSLCRISVVRYESKNYGTVENFLRRLSLPSIRNQILNTIGRPSL